MINILRNSSILHRKIKYTILFIFIIVVSFVKLNTVKSASFGSLGEQDLGSFENCGTYNGCISHIGYAYVVVKNVSINESGISYEFASSKYYQGLEWRDYSFYAMLDDVKSGGTLFRTILSKTGVSEADFLNNKNNYYIMAIPYFKLWHWPSRRSCNGKAGCYDLASSSSVLGTPWQMANYVRQNESRLGGIQSIAQVFPCTAYIPYSGAYDDNYCKWDDNRNYKSKYLDMASSTSRYGKALIWGSDINYNPKGTLQISKVDSNQNLINSDSTSFNLYNNDSCSGNPINFINFTGKTSIQLSPGSYSIKENKAPNGYEKSKTCYRVSNFESNRTYAATVVNVRSTGNLQISKVDQNGNRISSSAATFRLYNGSNCSGSVQQTITLTGSKTITLNQGSYSLKETVAPSGYDLNSTCRSVSISSGSTSTIQFTNRRSTGHLAITKVDSQGNRITSGIATFNLYKNTNCSGTAFKTVNIQGNDNVSFLETGTYSLKETKAPNGYDLDSSCKSFSITKDNITPITVANKKSRGNLEIVKIDKKSKLEIKSSPATFAIYKNTNCSGTPLQSFSVAGNGKVSLEIGDYSFKETKAPGDYYLDQTCHTATITKGTTTTKKIENEKQYGFLQLKKVDDKGNTISTLKTTFTLYKGHNCENNSIIQNIDVMGEISYENKIRLDIGKYSLRETKGPNGYLYDKDYCRNFSINKDNTLGLTFTNVKGCELDFSELTNKNDPIERIKLYEKFKNNGSGFNYTNLLDFDKVDNVCTEAQNTKSELEEGCLSTKTSDTNSFIDSNLSGYNKKETEDNIITLKVDDKNTVTAYCNVTFNLENNLKGTYQYTPSYLFQSNSDNKKFKSGQMVLNREEAYKTIARGTITKTCYVYGANVDLVRSMKDQFRIKDYTEYVKSVTFNNKALNPVGVTGSDWDITEGTYQKTNTKYVKFSKSLTTNYDLNPVYVQKGSGNTESCTSVSSTCVLLNYGFETKLNTIDGDYHAPFTVKVNKAYLDLTNDGINSKTCTYSVENEITTPDPDPDNPTPDPEDTPRKLNIEFRSIDTKNPFPGKRGGGRTVGSNWCDENKNCNKDNLKVQEVMNRTNSYNKKGNLDGDGPIYTIKLTPNIIQEIRDEYSDKNYDNYDVDSNGKNKFLQRFGIVRK